MTPKLFKIAVSGSRGITDRARIYSILDEEAVYQLCRGVQLEFHLGDAHGVDEIALDWARERDLDRVIFFADRKKYESWSIQHRHLPLLRESGTLVADWDVDGLKAGPFRNDAMIRGCDLLVAIWDGTSRGTRNAMFTARSRNIFIHQWGGSRAIEFAKPEYQGGVELRA